MGRQRHRDHPDQYAQLRCLLVAFAAVAFSQRPTSHGQRAAAHYAHASQKQV